MARNMPWTFIIVSAGVKQGVRVRWLRAGRCWCGDGEGLALWVGFENVHTRRVG